MVIPITMIILCSVMMWRLRQTFDSIFKDYGCMLWTVVAILIASLSISAIQIMLYTYSDIWKAYWGASYKRSIVYFVIQNLVGAVIPMLAQLATLIFGYIRYKDKEGQSKNVTDTDNDSLADNDAHQIDDGGDIDDR